MGFHDSSFKMSDANNLVYAKHQDGWEGFAKSCIDRTAAAAGLLLLSPVLLGCALAVRLDSKGPILFLQPRHGEKGEIFNIYKFRTMKVMETGADFVQARKNDQRVTRIGKFLRRTSLDELPQLINVLTGEMSLVGPRPHPIKLNEQFETRIHNYRQRHAVKPGLTGLAQIRGFRGPTETTRQMSLRVESDLEYIRSWSLWLDLRILIATPIQLLLGRNAY